MMERPVLHMIGNSHIDPVWFWRWEEGMQEVHATFRSALDRMKEFPDFKFTATSAAFFAYLEVIDPDMLDEIRTRVAEGRFEITGGWWIEPDCNLPCGEAFARQALYGQRTFQRLLGVHARIGSNVDSFGHNPQLPQLLRQGGLEGYVFLRPNVTQDARELTPGRQPAFLWQAPDGTVLPTVSLPGEYTTWFFDSTRENIQKTVDALGALPALPCCYGVGNHGGGPTIANIHAVEALRQEFPEHELRFSTLGAFFQQLKDTAAPLPTVNSYFDHINAGCYSVDHTLKQAIRQAEAALIRAEKLGVLAQALGAVPQETLAALWQRLLFCQFHDTMGGTIIEEAHLDTLQDVGGVTHQANTASNLAMQAIVAHLAVPGKGVPIFLFNTTEKPVSGTADVEISWFGNSDLRLMNAAGEEIPYLRVKQSCTMVWQHLGGRRRILFHAEIPAYGVAIFYADDQPSTKRLPIRYEGDPFLLENDLVSLKLDAQGQPISLRDCRSGFEALHGAASFTLWSDDRDPWGGVGHHFAPVDWDLHTDSVVCVEESALRKVLRVRQHAADFRVETHYSLYAGESSIRMTCRLLWGKPWHQLRFRLPTAAAVHVCESPFGVMTHQGPDEELFMHRFADAQLADGSGLAITNDSLYAFQPREQGTELLILRSPIYAQGADRSLWMHDYDSYHYLDLGEHAFSLTLTPHGAPLPQHRLFALADRHEQGTQYLVGGMTDRRGSHALPGFQLSAPNIRLAAAKRSEAGDAPVLRLQETDGHATQVTLTAFGIQVCLSFRPYEIKTLKLQDSQWSETNFLEE